MRQQNHSPPVEQPGGQPPPCWHVLQTYWPAVTSSHNPAGEKHGLQGPPPAARYIIVQWLHSSWLRKQVVVVKNYILKTGIEAFVMSCRQCLFIFVGSRKRSPSAMLPRQNDICISI